MSRPRSGMALRQIQTLFALGAVGSQTDGRLLETFSTGHREAAEAAFATLVERHGPMVLRVCRGVLTDPHDVNDAFQATFLVLVRKAESLWVPGSLGPWLHGVALRVATKARVAAARRSAHERRAAETARTEQGDRNLELAPVLHEEVDRLPPKYRAPVVLCYFEGLTHEGAAAALGWPLGTVHGRLSRARDLLRSRLTRRGLAPAGALLGAEEASAAVLPEHLTRAVMSLVAERSAGVARAAVVALAQESLRAMTMASLKSVWVLLVACAAVGLAGATYAWMPRPTPAAPQPPTPPWAESAKPQATSWPAGTQVSGRVVDHRGAAVVGADVALLGSEQLTVYVNPGPRPDRVIYSLATQPVAPSPPVKTDGQGRFSLRRAGSPADRIAVACPQLLLWEVRRKDVADADNLTITLPEPVSLTIRADIPGKPAKQEFWAVGRLLGRVDWQSDSLFYRGIEVPNPGVRSVGSLPPAQYAVERINFTPQGNWSNLMTLSERRVVPIEAGRTADLTYDRKSGRRVEGRVRGLEGVKLREALVTISTLGPEEQISPGAKKSRPFTGFDVVPVGPDGHFTMPSLPPNQYMLQLMAMLAATPQQEGQPYDYQGSKNFVVPETGEVSPVEVVAKRIAPAAGQAKAVDPKAPRLEVRARDEAGKPVNDFEVQLHAPSGVSPEAIGDGGLAVVAGSQLRDWKHGDLVVTAAGFASTVQEIGPVTELSKVDITLARGKTVRLRVRDADGKPVDPARMPLPQVYLERHRREAWTSLQFKDLEMRTHTIAGTNFLRVRRAADGDFTFQVRPEWTEPLYLTFSHPDVLLFYETGPASASALAAGAWNVDLPRPATLDVALKASPSPGEPSPFAGGYFSLDRALPGQADAMAFLDSGELGPPAWRATLQRLAPGSYSLQLQTKPRAGAPEHPDMNARPGLYMDMHKLELKPGAHALETFNPPAFRPDTWRGTRSATVQVTPAGDRSLAGQPYSVFFWLRNYGRLTVAEGTLGADGTIALEKVAPSGDDPGGGQYEVEVAGERLGTFRVKDQAGRQTFPLRMAVRGGDLAADAEAQDLDTGQPVQLSAFRGRIVFLEFWATWCGPCRAPMEHLVDVARRRGDAWRNDVALVAVSIDNDRAELRRHVLDQGLKGLRHLWSPRDHAGPSSAAEAYSISGVPTAFLIDRKGRVVWRGHPQSIDLEKKLDELRTRDRP